MHTCQDGRGVCQNGHGGDSRPYGGCRVWGTTPRGLEGVGCRPQFPLWHGDCIALQEVTMLKKFLKRCRTLYYIPYSFGYHPPALLCKKCEYVG